MRWTASDRGLSSTISYVLGLAIMAILITGLLIAGTDFVDSQRKSVVETETTVIAQQLAADLERADRLARAGEGTTDLRIEQRFPGQVSGVPYDVELIEQSGDNYVNVSAPQADVSTAVVVPTETAIRDGARADGGQIAIVLEDADGADPGQLVIRDV